MSYEPFTTTCRSQGTNVRPDALAEQQLQELLKTMGKSMDRFAVSDLQALWPKAIDLNVLMDGAEGAIEAGVGVMTVFHPAYLCSLLLPQCI